MSSRGYGASRPRQTQKIGVNPGALFRYPKTHAHMLLNCTGLVKRLNGTKTRFSMSCLHCIRNFSERFLSQRLRARQDFVDQNGMANARRGFQDRQDVFCRGGAGI